MNVVRFFMNIPNTLFFFLRVSGESNPLETKSYLDLTLHQRVLILKVLCDECLVRFNFVNDIVGNYSLVSGLLSFGVEVFI